jgi:glucoamylase
MILRLAVLALSIQEAVGEPIHRRDDFSASIEKQNEISLQGVLNNFGPTGSQAPGASAGVIIASPSTEDPNCKCSFRR